MSSKFVRDSILAFLQSDVPTEKVVDLTSEFQELEDMLAENGVNDSEPWLGVQFLPAEEVVVDIRGTNSKGKYRESGIINLHFVDIAKLGGHNALLNRAESVRNVLRGIRIANDIIVESVSPPNFGRGAALNFEGGYTSCVVQIDYIRDLDL